jgi:pimeloyl-ACP methyl ester carboxylesterase
MAVTQRAIAAAALGEPATKVAWKSKPSWYLVASDDHAINPEAERFMAERMKATTVEVAASHVVFISQPKATADLIRAAIAG